MYSNLESDERRRREVISCLYESLMQNWNLPKSVQDHYGFTEDYRLFHQLEDMDSGVYHEKREAGEVPVFWRWMQGLPVVWKSFLKNFVPILRWNTLTS